MKYLLIAIFVFVLFSNAIASEKKYIVITGDSQPVSYANIYFVENSRGTITNKSGIFSLPEGMIRIVKISHLGFQSLLVNLDTIKGNVMVLNPVDIVIDPVNIKIKDASDFVMKAIGMIDSNYINSNTIQKGFYSEKLLINNTLHEATECNFFVENKKYGQKKKGDIKIIPNNIKTYSLDSITSREILNGLLFSLDNADIVFSKNYIFNKEAISRHRFVNSKIEKFDGRTLFQIVFFPKEKSKKPNYHGKLYIDTTDYAIIRSEINFQNSSRKKVKSGSFSINYIDTEQGLTLSNLNSRLKVKNAFVDIDMTITDYHLKDIPKLAQVKKDVPLKMYTENDNNDSLKIVRDSVRFIANKKPFSANRYLPFLSYSHSTSNKSRPILLATNIDDFSHVVNYQLTKHINNKHISSSIKALFQYYVTNPIPQAIAERIILNRNNVENKMVSTRINKYYTSFCKISDSVQLYDFVEKNRTDFLRLNTIGSEIVKDQTENIEDLLFNNNYNVNSFTNVFSFNLYIKRVTLLFNHAKTGFNILGKQDGYYIDRPIRTISHLTSDEITPVKHISREDLTTQGNKLVRRVRSLSLINLISPYLIGINHISLFGLPMNFCSYYYLSPIGDIFEQNIWIKVCQKPYKIGFALINSKYHMGYNFDFTAFEQSFSKNTSIKTTVNLWKQPKNCEFDDKIMETGFGIAQNILIRMSPNISLNLGYKAKTNGFLSSDLNIGKYIEMNGSIIIFLERNMM